MDDNLMCEDELPEDLPDELYDFWFKLSHISEGVGVRMGPRVIDLKAKQAIAEVKEKQDGGTEAKAFRVIGDHPIWARPDKTFTGIDARVCAEGYAEGLRDLGYENVKVQEAQE